VTPVGVLTPQALLWSFMGSSRAYTIFVGAGELTGAMLLCFRRTTTLGALLLTAILANVLAMNLAYDVGVKLTAANLLAMAIILVGYDGRRLFDLFIRQQPTAAPEFAPLFASGRWNIIVGGPGSALMAGLFCFNSMTHEMLPEMRENGPSSPPPALFGIFDVMGDSATGAPGARSIFEPLHWRRIVFERYGRTVAQTKDGVSVAFSADLDTATHTVRLTERARVTEQPSPVDSTVAQHLVFHFSSPTGQRVILRSGQDSVILQRVDPSRYVLIKHRWLGWGGW